MKRLTVSPITRLEGHGKIEIFLDEQGNVANSYFQVPELRGFEQFCVGRQAEDMPVMMNRICGVCPEAHHIAAVKALDQLFAVEPPPAAKKIRELLYMAFVVTDHTTHFYALGGPDFIVGPDAPPAERNILGVIRKVGVDVGKQVIATGPESSCASDAGRARRAPRGGAARRVEQVRLRSGVQRDGRDCAREHQVRAVLFAGLRFHRPEEHRVR